MTTDKIIAVTGATGQQGGAVAARLLADGWRVRALTRDPAGPAAKALSAAGAEVVKADLDDRSSLDAAVTGAWGVYSVHSGTYTGGEYADDTGHEVRSGVNVADAAAAAGAAHVVYSSSVGIDIPEYQGVLPGLDNKKAVEAHIRDLGIAATFLRPASFMENFLGRLRGLRNGALATPLAPGTREPLIAVADIGAFAALAFANPDAFRGEAIDLAGDQLTQVEIAEALGRAAGREVPHVHITVEELRRFGPDVARALDTMNRVPFTVDIEALRRRHPELLTFDAWLAANRDAVVAKVTENDD